MDGKVPQSTTADSIQDGLAELSNRIDEQARCCHEDRAFLQRSMKETLLIHGAGCLHDARARRESASSPVQKKRAKSLRCRRDVSRVS